MFKSIICNNYGSRNRSFSNLLDELMEDFDHALDIGISNHFSFNSFSRSTDSEYIIEIDLPGIKKENITVEYDSKNRCIHVCAESDENDERQRKYNRKFSLGSLVDSENIKSEYNNGVLKITVPKSEDKDHKIQIKVE